MVDLFGNVEPGAYAPGELFGGTPSTAQAVGELRERMHQAERVARLRPDDAQLQRRAASARRDYLQARDYARSITAAELAAERAATPAEPAPTDNAELAL